MLLLEDFPVQNGSSLYSSLGAPHLRHEGLIRVGNRRGDLGPVVPTVAQATNLLRLDTQV